MIGPPGNVVDVLHCSRVFLPSLHLFFPLRLMPTNPPRRIAGLVSLSHRGGKNQSQIPSRRGRRGGHIGFLLQVIWRLFNSALFIGSRQVREACSATSRGTSRPRDLTCLALPKVC